MDIASIFVIIILILVSAEPLMRAYRFIMAFRKELLKELEPAKPPKKPDPLPEPEMVFLIGGPYGNKCFKSFTNINTVVVNSRPDTTIVVTDEGLKEIPSTNVTKHVYVRRMKGDNIFVYQKQQQ